MGQLTFPAATVQLTSYYNIYMSNGVKKMSCSLANESSLFEVRGIPDGAVVTRAVLTATTTNPNTGAQVAMFNGEDVRLALGGTVSIRVNVRSNRDVIIAYQYQCRGNFNDVTGLHPQTLTITSPTLTIDYREDEYREPPEDTREILVPKKGVKLFGPHETVFTGNGLCVLSPTSCVVREEAGGEYELEMQHPIDSMGKWAMLTEESIIEAPVPPTYVPEITMPKWTVWRTTKETSLYTTLPTYTKVKNALKKANTGDKPVNPWSDSVDYNAGDFVLVGENSVYKATRANKNKNPTSSPFDWQYVGMKDYKQPDKPVPAQYNPGVIKDTLAANELVYKVADYSETWMRVRSLKGIVGYVLISDCAEQQSEVQLVEPARTIYTQLFRVYEVSGEDDTHMVTVRARHISYDLQKNMLYDVQIEECEPATALALIAGSMVNDDETEMQWGTMQEPAQRKIMTDLIWPQMTCNWSFQNPIQALLDPEEGFAGKGKAKVIRDNQDIFLVENNAPRRGISITYGVNMRGVTWTRSAEDVVTRIIPRAKDENDDYIYLDDLYIDSEAIGEYAVISTEVLDSKYKVGQKIKHLDGTESAPLSLSEVEERMREEAEDRFYVDRCDSVSVALDVEFVLLGDTEEYLQYRNLQRVQLYDLVYINTGVTGLRTQAQVSGYEWDCIHGRYNNISIGRVFKMSRSHLPGYRLGDGAITYSKLAPDLIKYIKGAD